MVRISRHHLRLALAWLWLVDGVLSLQRPLLGKALVGAVLAPAAQHEPAFVAGPIHELIALVSRAPLPSGLAIALVQIALGAGLAGSRRTRLWLAASIVWAMLIWWLGEGLGGALHGATVLDGAPGAALLYALLAAAAWPNRDRTAPPSKLALASWSALWLGAAALQVAGGNLSANALGQTAAMARMGAPSWVQSIDSSLSRIDGRPVTVALVGIEVAVGLWSLIPGAPQRFAIAVGIALAIGAWVLFQGMGDLTSGMATDPNAGPLIGLLGICALASARGPRVPVTTAPSPATDHEDPGRQGAPAPAAAIGSCHAI